jgi:2-phospho-L-lactate guanylyltransferase
MITWTAVVPLKLNSESKSRLGDRLTAASRIELIEGMARHVLQALQRVPVIGRIVVLSAVRPDWWRGEWAADLATSLNPALDGWRSSEQPQHLLVVHGDLPFVQSSEIAELLEAAEATGAAMATDRDGLGTNALALSKRTGFTFHFGHDSRAKHAAQQPCAVLQLPGLAYDIDDLADLTELQRRQSM